MKARMAQNLGFLALFLIASICEAAIFRPISDSHRSAALEIFKPIDGSFKSLEDAYEALRTFEILGIGKDLDISTSTCGLITETLKSSSASLKDLSVALKSNRVLKCKIDGENFKDQAADLEIQLEKADQIFRSVKALGQSDGRWRYSSNKPESSTRAAGIALETLAGVVSLASADIDQSLIGTLKNDIVKLFDSVEKYDGGAMFFDEKVVDALEYQGPLSTTSSVVRGLVAFADVTSGKITVSGDKILGLAKYFLGIGVPGNSHDFFEQIDALALLENNRVSIPLILSLPSTVLSYSRNDQLKVKVNTVLGSEAPALTVKIVQAASVNSKSAPVIENQDLKYAADGGFHVLDSLPKDIDVGNYEFVFKIALNDPSQSDVYATGGRTWVKIYFTGEIKVENEEISVLDNDLGNVESQTQLDLSTDSAISLSANHLQKLRLSFQLSSPLGNAFKPHQDFLGLVDKLYYLSGKYDLQLTIGDAVMENSFFRYLGHIDLDLPEAPEKATRPPLQPIDPLSRFGPKEEIAHIFRAPETRPPKELSLAFLGLTLVPLVGFFIGLLRLGVNFKKFPTATVSAAFAALFHVGIAAVLCLYVLFWLKLNLFTTLKYLSFLGVVLLFVGHRTLSNLAKVKAD
uniref:Dolichyl-diphosphooligosaccharide--protein glycosyltransferase subunit 2 n=1 Tax=Chenopodium quinoa TaxID=63459 RepID=A0A803M4L6_CHEQI